MATTSEVELPLTGIRVLELAQALSGPFCGLQLADLGADVIKIEVPEKGDDSRMWGPPFIGDTATYFLSVNRNKRSIALNLKDEEDNQVARELASAADVVLENWRPGTAAKLGLGAEQLRKARPDLVYCSISGFGSDGPDKPGYDQVIQGMAGWMSLTGPARGEPYKVGLPIADMSTGLFATIGILGALLQRERSGKGAFVDVGMFDSMVALLTYQAGSYLKTGNNPTRHGNMHVSIVPYGSYRTSDGHINICVGNDVQWQRLCTALAMGHLGADERFTTNSLRVKNRVSLNEAIEPALARIGSQQLLNVFEQAGVPCGPIWNIHDIITSDIAAARGIKVTALHPVLGNVCSLAHPWRFDGARPVIRRPPPLLNENREDVLADPAWKR